MPAQLVENIQYFGSDGLPLVGAQIFIGAAGLEPIGNLISIFSDEALTVSIANPQTIGVDGFSANKIFIPAKYSLRVNTVLGAQFLLDLNVGTSAGTGTTSLKSVLGTDAITAEGEASVVTNLIDKEVYTLKIANTNTGTSGVTLKIDATAVKSIVKNFNQPIDPGDFTQNQIIRVQFNSTSDNYAWIDASVKTKRLTKGSDIATASSITVPDNDGNVIDLTGSVTVATINGVAGTEYTFQTDGAPTFTNSANLIIEGAVDYIAAAGDVFKVYMFTSSTCRLYNISKADGTATVPASGQWVTLSDQTANNSPSIDFESLITSKHDNYRIRYWDVRPASDAVTLDLRTSTNNGSSYDSGASDYNYFWSGGTSTTGVTIFENNAGNTRMVLMDSAATGDLGNAANESGRGMISFDNPLGTTFLKIFSFENAAINSGGVPAGGRGQGVRNATADIDAVQLLMSSGNIAEGRFVLEGLTK